MPSDANSDGISPITAADTIQSRYYTSVDLAEARKWVSRTFVKSTTAFSVTASSCFAMDGAGTGSPWWDGEEGKQPQENYACHHEASDVVLEVVPPVFAGHFRVRKEDLSDPVRILHRDGLALAKLAGIVVELR